jgi:DNA-binding response OmpR family regulator
MARVVTDAICADGFFRIPTLHTLGPQDTPIHAEEDISMAHRQSHPSILVVEDDDRLLETMADALTKHGCSVIGCATDTAGARRLLRHRPDIALVDYQLRDGPCDGLLSLLADKGVKITLLSGYGTSDLPASALRHPRLGKPFGIEALLDAVYQLDDMRYAR